MQLKSSLISFNHHFDSPVIPTERKKHPIIRLDAFLFASYIRPQPAKPILHSSLFILHSYIIPMQLVVPIAVSAAVKMDITI